MNSKFSRVIGLLQTMARLGQTFFQNLISLPDMFAYCRRITLNYTVRLCYAVARMLSVVDTLQRTRLDLRREILDYSEYLIKILSSQVTSSDEPKLWYVRIFHSLKTKITKCLLRLRVAIFRLWKPYAITRKVLLRSYRILIAIVKSLSDNDCSKSS